MKWKLLAVVAAVAGGVVWAARRKAKQERADGDLWAEATDPVTRFGQA